MTTRLSPPKVLVETWVYLINSSETAEVRERASNMLLRTFDHDRAKIAAYCKTHNLSAPKLQEDRRACAAD